MIILIANSLAYFDGTRRYDLGGLSPDQVYPRILERSLGTKVVSYAEPWRTIKDARGLAKKIPAEKASVFILNVGMAESLPKVYPFRIRMLVDRVPWRALRRRLNRFESILLRVTNKREGWIGPKDFRRYLRETVEIARARFKPDMVIIVNIFHVPESLEAKKRGTIDNAAVLNQVMKESARDLGTGLLDAYSIFDASYFLPDLVHLNARGHVKMASELQKIIEKREEIEVGSTG
ncbi:MAG TPA: SGNH/GDSL hydrolase family protein [Nitrososphaerales archaeon]|nr:SGNH/GDSL hydrolase family protein [Nitrososphaerales archaeon]